jgi:hypothetical protein
MDDLHLRATLGERNQDGAAALGAEVEREEGLFGGGIGRFKGHQALSIANCKLQIEDGFLVYSLISASAALSQAAWRA